MQTRSALRLARRAAHAHVARACFTQAVVDALHAKEQTEFAAVPSLVDGLVQNKLLRHKDKARAGSPPLRALHGARCILRVA